MDLQAASDFINRNGFPMLTSVFLMGLAVWLVRNVISMLRDIVSEQKDQTKIMKAMFDIVVAQERRDLTGRHRVPDELPPLPNPGTGAKR